MPGKPGYSRLRTADAPRYVADAHADEFLRAGDDIIDDLLLGLCKMDVVFCKIDISHGETPLPEILLIISYK